MNAASDPSPAEPYVWQESFLAHYPRKIKLAATVVLLAVLIAPWFLFSHKSQVTPTTRAETRVIAMGESAPLSSGHSSSAQRMPEQNDEAPIVNTSEPSDPAAVAANDNDDHGTKMIKAPDPDLTEDTAEGSLPKIGEDGRQPWQAYARPFNNADKRPRISIIVTGLGMSRIATDATLQRLPSNVTLAFDVQSQVIGAWLGRARQDGHEILLSLPMEPFDYPRSDPGPNTLLTNLPNSDNLERFYWALRQGTGYIGVTTLTGSRFTTDPTKVRPILEVLKDRGLMIFDARIAPHSTIKDLAKSMGVPVAASTQQIDETLTAEAIDLTLSHLEQTARLTGRAVGIASPLPLTLDRLEVWIKQLPGRGIALAPISAMVE